MDPLILYILIFAGLTATLFIQKYFRFIFHPRWTSSVGPINGPIMRHIVLPYLLRRRPLWGPVTRLEAILHTLHIAGTMVCNIIGVSELATARSRAGSLAILHLIPLTVIPQLSLGAAFFGVSLRTYYRLHLGFGRMAILQSLLHVILALRVASFDLGDKFQMYGLIAIISIGALSLIVLPWIRRRAYEICIKSHLSLGVFAMVTIWIHLKHRYRLNGFLLIAAIGLLLLTTLLYLALHLFRSIKKGQSLAIADIERLEDAVRLTFRPSRAWKVKAGQYVYIRAPGLRLLSFAESHPFNIIWWEGNGSDGKAGSISVLAKIQSGLTRDLFASSHKSFRLLVDGPYGKPLDTTHCDNIIFVATDIGIAAQLPYVQDLILRRSGADRKRRISVIWELEYEEHQDWICDWMDYLLDKDQEDLTLHYSLYVKHNSKNDKGEIGEKGYIGRRGRWVHGKPKLGPILATESTLCAGRLLISVSADPQTRDECRLFALSQGDKADFFEPEFQPPPVTGSFWAPKDKVPYAV